MEYANAENDASRQRQQMISMITKGVRVLILDAADTRALRSSIQEARKAGVPVVAYDRLAEGPDLRLRQFRRRSRSAGSRARRS